MNRQEIINHLRNIADEKEKSRYLAAAHGYREMANALQAESNPIKDIVKLNEERYGLDFNAKKALLKLNEELDEFEEAMNYSGTLDMLDALADIIVIATGEIRKMGYDPELVLNEVVKEISSRKQDKFQYERWIRGLKEQGEKWEKWETQPENTLYKADFEKAKL